MGYFVRMLETIGFRMIKAFNYDAYGSASLFVYAMKPQHLKSLGSILEQDCVMGTFTHHTTYIEDEWASANKYLPHIPFITRFHRGGINKGMSMLREDFIKTKKRFWIFLDDDIQFLNSDVVKNALEMLIADKYACMSVFSTFEKSSLSEAYDLSKLGIERRSTKWATGYFIMVDSWKVGNILPDMNLPYPNQSVDTSYSAEIRKAGWAIGISPDYVYHVKKNTLYYTHVIDETNAYLINKWGQFYYDVATYDHNVLDFGWRKEGCLIK